MSYKAEYSEDNSILGKKGYWRKKDKTLMKISDMTVNHILNCLGMFDTAGGDFWLRMPLVRHLWLTVNVKNEKNFYVLKLLF